jgi:SNF2 family DNA or RNA helicase
MDLFAYQQAALDRVEGKRRCAFYHDMGLGKTFTGAAKLIGMGCAVNLVVCQKSKIGDWLDHLRNVEHVKAYDLTTGGAAMFRELAVFNSPFQIFGVVNYDLLFRRDWSYLNDYGLMFDESSLLQNATSKRTKAAMKLAGKADTLVLLSGTPVDGKYERLWTQLRMLGWRIDEKLFWRQYVKSETTMREGFPITKVTGYKNEERLVRKMKGLGCDFLKTDDVIDLPDQRFIRIDVPMSEYYRKFAKTNVIMAFGRDFVGDTVFGDLTAKRQLAAAYSPAKIEAFGDLLSSTSKRLVVFYNFDVELEGLTEELAKRGRPYGVLNGKKHDLSSFFDTDDGVALIQYQSGAMGVNLQQADTCVYFSPPLASSLFEQSKKRIHRVGQDKPCTYYELVSKGTVEEKIYDTLAMRRDYTEKLFEMGGD